MDPVLGYFLFKILGDGCLGSKYGNTIHPRLFAECAVKTSQPDKVDDFIGEYITTWIENDGAGEIVTAEAILEIFRRPHSTSQYRLIWRDREPPNSILYYGEGMLSDNVLVGSYWNAGIRNGF